MKPFVRVTKTIYGSDGFMYGIAFSANYVFYVRIGKVYNEPPQSWVDEYKDSVVHLRF